MFVKGDKIVYPMYGAGVIIDLEEIVIDGISKLYYVMAIPIGDLKIRLSTAKAELLGVRSIYSKEQVSQVIAEVLDLPIDMPENWNERYKQNMEKIKTGVLKEVMTVYRNLLLRERERGLSSAEKKLLTTAKQIIVSEIILSQDIEKEEAETILFDSI